MLRSCVQALIDCTACWGTLLWHRLNITCCTSVVTWGSQKMELKGRQETSCQYCNGKYISLHKVQCCCRCTIFWQDICKHTSMWCLACLKCPMDLPTNQDFQTWQHRCQSGLVSMCIIAQACTGRCQHTCSSLSSSGRSRPRCAAGRPEVRRVLSRGCRASRADRHWLERARCLAVMERRPESCMAPAPSTSWHMRELNTWSQLAYLRHVNKLC